MESWFFLFPTDFGNREKSGTKFKVSSLEIPTFQLSSTPSVSFLLSFFLVSLSRFKFLAPYSSGDSLVA